MNGSWLIYIFFSHESLYAAGVMAGTAMDEKWSIDKLDSSNWITWKFQMRHLLLAKGWKFQMRHLLLAKGLWGYVDGTEVLREDASVQQRADFKKASQKAFSTIVMD